MNSALSRFARRILFAASVVAALSSLPATAQTDPQISIARVDGIRVQGNRTLLALTLDVHNPNGVVLPLQALRFECFFNDVAIAQGASAAPIDIPANGNALLPVTLDVDAATVIELASTLTPGTPIDYRIEGIAEVGRTGIPIPFSRSGTVDFGG